MEYTAVVDVHEAELIQTDLHRSSGHFVSLGESIDVWPSSWRIASDVLRKELPRYQYRARVTVDDPLLVRIISSRLQIADVLHALVRSTQSSEHVKQTDSRMSK